MRALQGLLEHFSFWPFLQELIDLHSLEVLKEKLSTHKGTVVTSNSLKSQKGKPDEEKKEIASSTSESIDQLEPLQFEHSTESLATSLQYKLVVSCSPPVVSGACRLLLNLLLSFPEQMGARLDKSGFVISLVRWVHACMYVCNVHVHVLY